MGPFTESGNRLFFKLAGEGHSELLQREDPIKESESGDDEQAGVVSSHPQESEREREPPGTRMHACETPPLVSLVYKRQETRQDMASCLLLPHHAHAHTLPCPCLSPGHMVHLLGSGPEPALPPLPPLE